LEIGRQCSRQPAEKTELCATLADLQVTWKRPAEAMAAWQAILSDEALRDAPLSEPLGGRDGTLAGVWARACIDSAIQRHGRSVYSRFDEEAGKLLQTGQVARLEELLERYPNSQHVPAALLRIGQQAVTKDAKAALEPLRKAVALAEAGSPIRAQAMLALGRAYEGLGNLQAAATWMARLASEAAEMRVERGGRTWSAAEYAADLAGRLPREKPAVRRIDLPLQPGQSRTHDDTVSLLGTLAGGSRAGADGPTLIWSAGTLQALDGKSDQPAWPEAVKTDSQPILLAADGGRLVIHDRYRVVAVDAGNGRSLWAWNAHGPDPRGANVDPESVPTIQAAAAAVESVVVFTADGQAACLDRSNGAVRWQRPAQPAYVAGLAISGDLAVYRGGQAGNVVYRVLDARTGRDVSLIRPSRDVPAETVEMLPAAMVMLVGTGSIEAYDAYSGAMTWQVLAKGRFQPGASLRKDTSFYIADGERHLVKIDLLTGSVAWRAVTPPRTGGSVAVLADGGLIWGIGEQGAHVLDDAAGKATHTLTLPAELAPHMDIRSAVACDAGVLCLAVKQRKAAGRVSVPPAVLALFTCRNGAGGVSVVARLDEATGLVSGMSVADKTVMVAAGNKVITLRGQAEVSR
jgi:outer membrane protein assembly factor BamB